MSVIFVVIGIGIAVAFFSSRAFRGPVTQISTRLATIEANTRKATDDVATIEKACPNCAEAVKGAARVCRFCGYTFDEADIIVAKSVILKSVGPNKINVIGQVRSHIRGMGLKAAKDLVESAPVALVRGVPPDYAVQLKKIFEENGATIEII
jgi:large subunit ribosomal protein L7/L12